MGAWIETTPIMGNWAGRKVAPYMGAWIETLTAELLRKCFRVAPYMGAWIETFMNQCLYAGRNSRSLHGGVD